ncbi:hypothetical protein EON83_03245 [bacterium]|nr:MAG: hypothetical protein EON83_03245 [bacterium]
MKYFVFISSLVLFPWAAHADYSKLADYHAMPGVGGSISPTLGENKAIRLVREFVVLTANSKDYSARADFVLSNTTGQTQTVAISFPEGNYGGENAYLSPPKTGFLSFKAFVNDRSITAKRVLRKDADTSGFNSYWEKNLLFAPHQKISIRYEYSSPYGESVHWGMSRILPYWFMGQNWNGPVDESTLELRVTQPGLWRVVANDDTHNSLAFQVKSLPAEARFRHTWKNRKAQNGIRVGLERVVPLWREDTVGTRLGTDNSKESRIAAALTAQVVRVGPISSDLKEAPSAPHSTAGFTLNGVFYVGESHLSNLISEWAAEQNPRIGSRLVISGLEGFDWYVGKTHIHGKMGENILTINGKTVALGTPIISAPTGGWFALYIPITPLANALGWKVTMQGERLFTLERGNWKA